MAFLGYATRDHRFQLMRELMDRHSMDALAFTSGDFLQFATNFQTDVQVWERPVLCVVPRNGDPFAILNEMSTNHWRFALGDGRLWVKDAVFYAERPAPSAGTRLITQWREVVAESLIAHNLSRARIGVEAEHGLLCKAVPLLPSITIKPMLSEMRGLRWVKCTEEIELMRQIAALTDWVQERYRENIRADRSIHDLDMTMATLMGEEAARRFPGEDLEILRCRTLSGPSSAAPHGDSRQLGARIERGQVLINVIIPRLNGLVVENERTWLCGTPSREHVTYFEVARAANEEAVDAAVAGAPVYAMDRAAQAVIDKAGLGHLVFHRAGHGMGIIGHEFPHDAPFNDRPLLAHEVYSVEPGLYVFGLGGFRKDDTVVIGARPEVLTKAPGDIHNQTIL